MTETQTSNGVAADQLRAFIERVERLEEEKKDIADGINDVFAEAKGNGFDVKVMKAIIKRRKEDADAREEFDAIYDLYLHALGMLGETAVSPEASEARQPIPHSGNGESKSGE